MRLTFEKRALNILRTGGGRGGEGVSPHPTHPPSYVTVLSPANRRNTAAKRKVISHFIMHVCN